MHAGRRCSNDAAAQLTQLRLKLGIVYAKPRSFNPLVLKLLLQMLHGGIFSRELLLESFALSAQRVDLLLQSGAGLCCSVQLLVC